MTYEPCPVCKMATEKDHFEPDHTCPYQSDINDNDEFQCNCCRSCEGECCDDI